MVDENADIGREERREDKFRPRRGISVLRAGVLIGVVCVALLLLVATGLFGVTVGRYVAVVALLGICVALSCILHGACDRYLKR